MAQRAKGLQSIKSLPVDFKLVKSDSSEQLDVASETGYRIAPHSISENGEFFSQANSNVNRDNDESPYRSLSFPMDERPFAVNDDPNIDTSHFLSFAPTAVESNWSDTSSYATQKKTHSWFQLPNGNWELATIISTSGTESVISFPEGKVLKVKYENLLPANPDILDGVDDLMQLSYLNEPSILNNLQYRYSQDMIYTKVGPVLVAINPFKKVPLYGNDHIEAYRRKSIESPHVYTITDTSIREMVRDEVNQSIIIRLAS